MKISCQAQACLARQQFAIEFTLNDDNIIFYWYKITRLSKNQEKDT